MNNICLEFFVYRPTLASYSLGHKLVLDTAVIRIRIVTIFRPNAAKFLSISCYLYIPLSAVSSLIVA